MKIYFHAGGSKTGSSFIQNYLNNISNELINYGYSYRNCGDFKGGITSGNGEVLVNHLLQGTLTKDIILSYFYSSSDVAIISSEYVESVSVDALKYFFEMCFSLSIDVFFIYFIRDPFSCSLSAYDQSIKRHGYSNDYAFFIDGYDWIHADFLRKITSFLSSDQIFVLNYNACRRDLSGAFFQSIGLKYQKKKFEFSKDTEVVNRSLTRRERTFLKKMNQSFGQGYSRFFSDLILSLYPYEKYEPDSIIWQNVNSSKFDDDLIWVNSNFFESEEGISSGFDLVSSYKPIDESNSNCDFFYTNIVLHILKNLAGIKSVGDNALIAKLISVGLTDYSYGDLPDGFDPVRYLVFNPDVLALDLDPVEHYLANGQYEDRKYK